MSGTAIKFIFENKIKIRSFERKRVPVQKMCISFLLHYTNARTNYQCGAVKKQLLIIAAFKYSTWREGNRNLTNYPDIGHLLLHLWKYNYRFDLLIYWFGFSSFTCLVESYRVRQRSDVHWYLPLWRKWLLSVLAV